MDSQYPLYSVSFEKQKIDDITNGHVISERLMQ